MITLEIEPFFGKQSFHRIDVKTFGHADSNNGIMGRKDEEAFCILEGFDFLKYELPGKSESKVNGWVERCTFLIVHNFRECIFSLI